MVKPPHSKNQYMEEYNVSKRHRIVVVMAVAIVAVSVSGVMGGGNDNNNNNNPNSTDYIQISTPEELSDVRGNEKYILINDTNLPGTNWPGTS